MTRHSVIRTDLANESETIRISVGGFVITVLPAGLPYSGAFAGSIEEGWNIWSYLATALFVAVIARTLMVSVSIDRDGVTVHNFWKHTRVEWATVERVTCSDSFRFFLRSSPAAVGLRLKGFESQTWETLENTLTVKATIGHVREDRVKIVGVFRHFAELNGVVCNLREDHIKRAIMGCKEYP